MIYDLSLDFHRHCNTGIASITIGGSEMPVEIVQ
jgi:hypothetical protein